MKSGQKTVSLLFKFFLFFTLLVFSCKSAEERLEPLKSTSEYRLDDIEKTIADDPVKGIHLIHVYRALYGEGSRHALNYTPETAELLLKLEGQAVENLKAAQLLAFGEKRWEDAASMARSLAAMGVVVGSTGMEPEIMLAEAKSALEEGDNLRAFLSAMRSHEISPLSPADLLPFLERAVDQKQRRTAAYFLAAADKTRGSAVPKNIRDYAEGRDTVSDMVKGVATVLVDRGVRTEKGMTYADRLLGSAFFVESPEAVRKLYSIVKP